MYIYIYTLFFVLTHSPLSCVSAHLCVYSLSVHHTSPTRARARPSAWAAAAWASAAWPSAGSRLVPSSPGGGATGRKCACTAACSVRQAARHPRRRTPMA